MTRKELRRLRIKTSVRGKISGTKQRPRLTVFRSNKQIYAQLIDDVEGQKSYIKTVRGVGYTMQE